MIARRHFSLEILEARIAPAATPFFNLGNLNGNNGFVLTGEFQDDAAGAAVSGAGDVNGDGLDDFIVGAPLAGSNIEDPDLGAGYVVFGTRTGFPSNFSLASLDGSNGFKLNGVSGGDHAGSAVAGGDFNGDGFDDLLIGAEGVYGNGANSGAAYVVFGHSGVFPASIELTLLDGANGFRINGASAGDNLGMKEALAAAGDINGDGFGDLILGTPNASDGGAKSGAAYVLFGRAANFPPVFNLSAITSTEGFVLTGAAAGDRAGAAVAGVGDVNGDGLADLAVGAPLGDGRVADSGAAYVIFGQTTPFPGRASLGDLNGSNGFKLGGLVRGELLGASVSGGDVNGDGRSDLIVGSPGAGLNGPLSGAVHVVFGQVDFSRPAINVAGLNGVNGFTLIGNKGGTAGADAVAVGDFNGDSFADLLISANRRPGIDTPPSGMTFLVLGRADGFLPRIPLLQLGGGFGVGFRGAPGTEHDFAVGGAGDINGDGLADLVIGSQYAGGAAPGSGAAYVIFGRPAVQADPRTVVYSEPDGDVVTVQLSEGELDAEALQFVSTPQGFVLDRIDLRQTRGDLSASGVEFGGASLAPARLIIKATQQDGSAGSTNVGTIDASGRNLSKVRLAGDLTSLRAGDGNEKFAVEKIVVDSWGASTTALNSLLEGGAGGASLSANGSVGKIKVLKDVLNFAASIGVGQEGKVNKMTVGGSMSGSSIDVGAKFGALRVKGSVSNTDFTVATDFKKVTVDEEIMDANFVVGGALLSATFKGNMSGSTFRAANALGTMIVADDVSNSTIRAGATIDNFVVGGSVIDSVLSAPGTFPEASENKAQAFKIIGIQGDLVRSQILAGYDQNGMPVNGDAGIGKFVVKGNLEASSVVAGAIAGADGFFGNDDDGLIAGGSEIIARIASIKVKGAVLGSAAGADHFGIVAEELGKIKVGGLFQPLIEGPGNDLAGIPLGTTDDVRAREVA